jgi:hypothetical protein
MRGRPSTHRRPAQGVAHLLRRFTVIGFVLVILALLLFSSLGSYIYTDWLWFKSVGYLGVFLTAIASQVALGAGAGLVYAGLLFVLLLLALRAVPPITPGSVPPALERFLTPRRLRLLALLFALLIGALVGFSVSRNWLLVQAFLHRQPFGVQDPLFGRDVGFYVFTLPVLRLAYSLVSGLLLTALAAGGLIMLIAGAVELGRGRFRTAPPARRYLSLILAAFFAVKAWGYLLGMYRLLYSPRGAAFGASYTDVHAVLPGLKVLIAVALIGAALLVVNAFRRDNRLLVAAVGGLILVSLMAGLVVPAVMQQFSVSPNEIARERPYIEKNIQFTRLGYDLDRIAEKPFAAALDLTYQDIEENRDTIDNIRLWDWRPLLQTYGQLQEIRLYYNFDDVDVDRYRVGGRLRQVMLSAREISSEQLPEQARTWINLHLKYTHGYGVVASPSTEFTSEGLPLLWVRDLPPQSVPGLELSRPEIYYGEQTHSYAIVNTSEPEFDYPVGDQNAYTTYQGTGGVPIASFLNRLSFAFRLSSYRVLFTGAMTPESRVLINRDIGTAMREVAPFLAFDDDPYLVIDGGRLYWMCDAYTMSSAYPYSEPYRGGINYLRNAVKVVVDAYNGTLDFYVVEDEPIIKAYAATFPGLLKPISAMPEGLRRHVRYPGFLFDVQAEMYAKYHMGDPVVFYNREDAWAIPNELFGGQEQQVEPYYTVMRLPGETEAEFIYIVPFTPAGKSNMISWLAARCDPDHYGELLVYKFPKQKLVFGPMQIESRINQDPEISQNLTLWGQKGSEVLRGNLLVIPIDDSVLYIEPLYLVATENQLPELKRVVGAYGDHVYMGENLEDVLRALFGGGAVAPEEPGGGPGGPAGPAGPATTDQTVNELIGRATALWSDAQEHLHAGDWAGYGEAIDELGKVLRELEGRSTPAPGQGGV